MIWRPEREKRSDSRAETNQRVRPQPGGFAVQFPIQTENRPQEQRGPETQHDLFISSQHGTNIQPEILGSMQAFSKRRKSTV
jgi:hypothetical protein